MSVHPTVGGAAASPPPYAHHWNAPEITSPPHPPPSRGGLPSARPLAFNRLQFNPLGLFDLRRRIGIFQPNPSIWNVYGHRFISSDVAWFAAGKNSDGQHYPASTPGFFGDFDIIRDSLPTDEQGAAARRALIQQARTLMFDLGTLVDRAAGSTTMIMHVDGATRPNTPAHPEFLRASVYLPPLFLRRNPDAHVPIAKIVQSFLESVGVPTVTNFLADGEARGWNFTQQGPTRTPNHIAPGLVIPQPTTANSAHYVFRGRPRGSLDVVTAPAAPTPPPAPAASQTSTRYGSEEPLTADAANLLDAIEEKVHLTSRVVALENELAQAQVDLGDFQMQADYLSQQNSDLYTREQEHEQQKRELHGIIGSLQIQLAHAQGPDPPASPRRTPLSPRAAAPLYWTTPRTPVKTRPIPSSSVLSPPLPSPTKKSASSDSISTVSDISDVSVLALPSTTTILEHYGILEMMPSVRGILQDMDQTSWYGALTALNVEEDAKDFLLDAMAADMAYD